MTRGSGILIYKDAEGQQKIVFSTEFNGEMYADGNGQDFLDVLKNVNTLDEFKAAIHDFNENYYDYDNMERPQYGWIEKGIICQPELATALSEYSQDFDPTDLNSVISEYEISSDYLYIKNATGKNIELKFEDEEKEVTVIIPPNEITVTLHSAEICNNMYDKDNFVGLNELEVIETEKVSALEDICYDLYNSSFELADGYSGEFKDFIEEDGNYYITFEIFDAMNFLMDSGQYPIYEGQTKEDICDGVTEYFRTEILPEYEPFMVEVSDLKINRDDYSIEGNISLYGDAFDGIDFTFTSTGVEYNGSYFDNIDYNTDYSISSKLESCGFLEKIENAIDDALYEFKEELEDKAYNLIDEYSFGYGADLSVIFNYNKSCIDLHMLDELDNDVYLSAKMPLGKGDIRQVISELNQAYTEDLDGLTPEIKAKQECINGFLEHLNENYNKAHSLDGILKAAEAKSNSQNKDINTMVNNKDDISL